MPQRSTDPPRSQHDLRTQTNAGTSLCIVCTSSRLGSDVLERAASRDLVPPAAGSS
jgi:hypothetical protein